MEKRQNSPDRQMIWMTADSVKGASEERLTLRGQMADLALVPGWIEYLAAEYAIPARTQYAMNLCLEEVLSNIVRHGYANTPDRPILIRYKAVQENSSLLVIDDEAPPFDPLAAEEIPVEDTLDGTRIGGLGLRLLRSFSTSLDYERTPAGNRLSIGFSSTP